MNNMKNTISKGTMNTPRHFTNLFTHVTRTRLNNVLRLATLAAACLALPTHALAQSSCPGDLNDDGEVNSADVGLVLIDYGPCPAPTPSISLVNPSSGQTTGFTAFTIFGTNFTGATSVTVGGVAATSIVVVSSTAITALSPAHSVGAVDIVVVTPNGTATLVGAFTYNAWYTILEQAPNATVVLDATVRANIVASGHPWHIRDNSSGIEMLLIPGGTFNMGEEGSATSLVHTVTLTKAFYLGKTEVTQAQWQAKMGSNPSYFSGNANNPVEQVSWDDIVGFNTVTRLRLPSEAEWEYACRGGTTTAFHSMPGYPNGTNDDSLLGNIAWYSNNNGEYGSSTYGPKPVAGKAANAFGLYDMSGNVWEWCNDLSDNYPAGNATDPTGPSVGGYGDYRVRRGGHFYAGSETCRSSLRNGRDPGTRDFNIGFRVARTP
jgi:formylglycine-generating enzyme required for sulfatase activity